MKMLKLFLFSFTMFALNITGMIAQSNLPEPTIARSEAGQDPPNLEEIRILLMKRQQKEFVVAVDDLDSAISAKRKTRGGDRMEADQTKEEFAALEWLYYYFCSGRLPKPQEIWEWRFTGQKYFDRACSILSKIIVATGVHVDAFSPDEKKFQKVRMAWASVLLRKFKVWHSEFEEEEIAIKSRARYYEFMTDFYKRNGDTVLGDMTEETAYQMRKERHAFDEIVMNMGSIKATLDGIINGVERSYFEHVLRYCRNDFSSIDPYLRMAGYETESDLAMLITNTRERLMDSSWSAPDFENYINRKKINLKRLEDIATLERTKKSDRIKRLQRKWKTIAEKNKIEYDKVMKAYWEAYRKKYGEPKTR
jgi:hypothetical protein